MSTIKTIINTDFSPNTFNIQHTTYNTIMQIINHFLIFINYLSFTHAHYSYYLLLLLALIDCVSGIVSQNNNHLCLFKCYKYLNIGRMVCYSWTNNWTESTVTGMCQQQISEILLILRCNNIYLTADVFGNNGYCFVINMLSKQ